MTIKLLQAWNGYAAGSILNTGDLATEAALVAQFVATYDTTGGTVPPRDQFSATDLRAGPTGLTAAQIAAGAIGVVSQTAGGSQIGPDGSPVSGDLRPTGNDDAALLNEYVHDMAASGRTAVLGSGDFIVGSPMVWRSAKTLAKWGGKGVGLAVKGDGPQNTRLLWAAPLSDSRYMLTFNSPASSGIANRNYLTSVSGMSIVRAPGGAEIAAGSIDGCGIYAGPSEVGEVFQGARFADMLIDGFQYGVTLSDATGVAFDQVWFLEFLVGLRLGYNCDIIKVNRCFFGSEQFGLSYRNNAIGIQTGFSDGFHSAGNGNNIEIDHTWFMKHGCAVEIGAQDSVNFWNSYLEDIRQYWRVTGAFVTYVGMDWCTLSKPNSNDDASYPKMVMGSAGQSRVRIAYCDGGGTGPLAPWLVNTGANPTVEWVQNKIPVGSVAHYRWNVSGNERNVTFNTSAGNGRVSVTMGGTYGLQKTSGDNRVLTMGTTGTITCDHWAADVFEIPAMTGSITPTITGGAVPAMRGQRLKFRIQAGAASPETKTVTWPTNIIFQTAFAQPSASDASKWTYVEVERTASNWMVVSPPNQWVA